MRQRSARPLLYGAVAALIGIALAAFYALPAAYEERWVNISQVLSPGVRPGDNFLFARISDPDHDRFNLLVSLVAVGEIVWLGLAIWFGRRHARGPGPWKTLAIWGVGAALLMFS